MDCSRPGFLSITNSQSLLKLRSIDLVMPSNHLILCHRLLLLPSIFSSIRVFSKESVLQIRWPKYWSFSFSISPSNEYSGLISFRIDWFDLLAVQGTLQHHSSKASILWHPAFFMVQLSHPNMTTGKTTALTIAFFFPLHKMMEKKDVRSSSPLRTPKLQLTAEQPSTGESWIPPKKETPHPRAKDKPQQDSESESRSVVSNSLRPHGLSPGNSPGQNSGVGTFSLLQGIFPTQG